MKKQIFIICFIIIFLFPSPSYAAPQINEFSSSTSDDWIEIYNPDPNAVDLSMYKIRDSTENNVLDLSGTLLPSNFLVFEWANKLNNGGDIIKLVFVSDDSLVDQVTYGNQGGLIAPSINQSAGRISDGSNIWTLFIIPSRNSSNNSSPTFIPPTPTPSRTPTPTKIPPTQKSVTNISTKTISPTKIVPTPNASPIPVKSSSNLNNSGKIAQDFESGQFIGIRNLTEIPKKTSDKAEVLGVSDRRIPVISIFGGVLLILAGGFIFSLKYINIKELYEKIFNEQ